MLIIDNDLVSEILTIAAGDRPVRSGAPTRLDWGVITYTFHPQVSGRGHRMLALERLIGEVGAVGAAFVRMDAAVEEFARRVPSLVR